jgi:hypothetical protein
LLLKRDVPRAPRLGQLRRTIPTANPAALAAPATLETVAARSAVPRVRPLNGAVK